MSKNSPVIVDISSDEEGDFGNENYMGSDKDDHAWLSGVLGEVDGNEDVNDSDDDVMVVSEVFPNPRRSRVHVSNQSQRFVVNTAADEDDGYREDPDEDDDGNNSDCVILDCEPCGSQMVENSGAYDADDDTDDLKIVGEKGQVACRDFPHPRHHCANFPFDSTPHQVYCHKCHCYVCDSIAPCRYWGTGQSNSDHCNANEKMERWVVARKTKLMHNQDSVSPDVTLPRIIKCGRSARDPSLNPSLLLKAKYPADLISGGSQVSSPPALKRPGILGDSFPNKRKRDPQIPFFNRSHSSNQQNSGPATSVAAANSAFSSEELADSLPSQNPDLQPSDFFNNQTLSQFPIASQPHFGVGLENGVLPPQPKFFHPNGGPYSQPSVSFNNVGNQAFSQPRQDYQPNFGMAAENWVSPQPDTLFHPNRVLPSQRPHFQPSDTFNNHGNQALPQSPLASQTNLDVGVENSVLSSQPNTYFQPNRALISQSPYSQPSHSFGYSKNQTISQSLVACKPSFGVGLANRVPIPCPDAAPNFGVGLGNRVSPAQHDNFFQPDRALSSHNPYSQPSHSYNNFGNQMFPQSETSSSHHDSGNPFGDRFPDPHEYRIPAPLSPDDWNASSVISENPHIATDVSRIPDLEPANYLQYQSATERK